MQMDPDNSFPDNGRYYCGAVAMANNLVWLSNYGYPGLAVKAEMEKVSVLRTAEVLGSEKYLNISPLGNPPSFLLSKTQKYIVDQGYKVKESTLQGWEAVKAGEKFDLKAMKKHFDEGDVFCLMLGKYSYNPDSKQYLSKGFHYVTLAGYKHSNPESTLPDTLAVQCPSPRSGKEKKIEYVELCRMKSGTLHISLPGIYDFTVPASGSWTISDGLLWKRENELIVIHGYISLELEKGDQND